MHTNIFVQFSYFIKNSSIMLATKICCIKILIGENFLWQIFPDLQHEQSQYIQNVSCMHKHLPFQNFTRHIFRPLKTGSYTCAIYQSDSFICHWCVHARASFKLLPIINNPPSCVSGWVLREQNSRLMQEVHVHQVGVWVHRCSFSPLK